MRPRTLRFVPRLRFSTADLLGNLGKKDPKLSSEEQLGGVTWRSSVSGSGAQSLEMIRLLRFRGF